MTFFSTLCCAAILAGPISVCAAHAMKRGRR